MLRLLLPALFLLQCHPSRLPAPVCEDLTRAFLAVPAEAQMVNFTNQLPINNEGGHLQGVQILRKGKKEYAMLSGSSSTCAYYAVASLGNENRVIGVHKLMDKPFKHAGGFQVYQGLMAVGVEDNDAKDRSRVFVYRIDDPEAPPSAPLSIIERQGEVRRSTAGCVGIAQMGSQVLLVVGDWDTKHLDFYTAASPRKTPRKLSFEPVFTIDTEQFDKSDWIDPHWLSYQNINLIKGAAERLYMIGMTSNVQGEDVADLYEIICGKDPTFRLKKIASRRLPEQDRTKFRWGAGIDLPGDGKIRIVSCGENLWKESQLTVY